MKYTVIIAQQRDEQAVLRSASNRSKPCFVKGKYFASQAEATRAGISSPKTRADFRFVSKEEYEQNK